MAVNIPVLFPNDSQLRADELLLYSLMTLTFPIQTFSKNHASNKYNEIISVIFQITGVKYNSHSIQNYFYRVRTNSLKGFGKSNGTCRWNYYQAKVKSFTNLNRHFLEQALDGSEIEESLINSVMQQLTFHCTPEVHVRFDPDNGQKFDICNANRQFELEIMPKLTSQWSNYFNNAKNTLHFYQFGNCPGYAEREIEVTADGTWSIHFEGKHRNINLDWLDISDTLKSCADLVELLNTVGGLKSCQGCNFDKYRSLIQGEICDQQPVFKTKDGTPAAMIDIMVSKDKEKVIRSAKCLIFLVESNVVKTPNTCEACKNTDHYLRTMLSRKNNDEGKHCQRVRLDYLSKEDLLDHARNAIKDMKYWKQRCQRLQEYRNKMTTVGPKTNNDLQTLFTKMYNGISEKKHHLQNPICQWKECHEKFENVELLYDHTKQHAKKVDTIAVAPIERDYRCQWERCDKHFGKLKLLHNHMREHTGYVKDELMEILLKDQAMALQKPAKQMKWHPLVIQWCLKLYCKSHSIYESMRSSGALKLPSGRTLSDYKNFNTPKSGWNSETIESMKMKFDKMKPPKHAKLGGLFFDEVKIKEGLVFDSSSWELIGFTDIHEENGTNNPLDKLATHVLQFFYRSLFFKFDFPCAYFLTQGATAVQLNRMFWFGISLLHSFGFDVLLVCCDGASSNRTFYTMNTNNPLHSECLNPFSNYPIFFMSDPPHLMKKLRNNLFNSGFNHKRFTRHMMNNENYILWDHVNDVYKREKLRNLYVTDLRSSHINLDNLSKMRVKLAVQTLSEKVTSEMSKCDDDNTKATQNYITICSKFWSVFNSAKPLRAKDVEIIQLLDDVVKFFKDWQETLKSQFETKTEQAKHFISWQTMFDLMVNTLYLIF